MRASLAQLVPEFGAEFTSAKSTDNLKRDRRMNLSIQEAQPTLLQPPEHYLTYIDSKTLATRWGLPET